MPVFTPYSRKNINVGGDPKAQEPRYFFNTLGKGVARKEDIVRIRQLETSPAITLPMNIIKTQLAETLWEVRPEEEFKDDEAYKKAANEIADFFDGRFNVNGEAFGSLLCKYAGDMLSIGNGCMEKVWYDGKENTIGQLFVRDSGLFTKNIDEFGQLPSSDSKDPAYYQWGGGVMSGVLQRDTDSQYLVEYGVAENTYRYRISQLKPVEFNRKDIMWTDLSPRSYDAYSRGLVSDAAILAEISLNALLVNRKSFRDDEVPEGILAIMGAGQDEVSKVIDYWRAEVKGKSHKLPIIGGMDGVNYTPFRGSMKELQYLESQQWYVKMVWMMFGLNANEVGDIAEVTRPGGTKQFSVDVWRKTTMPLLSKIEHDINRQIMPYLEPYQRMKGGLVFKFKITHPDADDQMRARQDVDLDKGLVTLNQVLVERGEEPVPWGDMPHKLYQTMIDRHPEWFYDEFITMDNKPEAPPPNTGGGGLFGLQRLPAEGEKKHFPYPMTKSEDMEGLDEEQFNDDKELFDIGQDMAKDIEKFIRDELKGTEAEIRDIWPKSFKKGATAVIPIAEILRGIGLAEGIYNRIVEGNREVYRLEFIRQAEEIEDRIEEATGERVEFLPPPINERSTSLRLMLEAAEVRAMSVEQSVREQIGTVLTQAAEENMTIQELTEELDERVDEISQAKSRLIARTEVMGAKRESVQLVAESTNLIAGKQWDSTPGNRTRAWHKAMDGVIVGKYDKFTVPGGFKGQPKDYPRETYVVGGDQPYNCRCDQRHVLAEDMPSSAVELAARYDNIRLKRI